MAAVGLGASAAYSQPTGSWGDQGNGRFRNPILESNFPDNDVIRVKDTFYMMSSTNHWAPGMIILRSRDLVNWEYSNAILPAPIAYDRAFDLGQRPALVSRGTWAGSFGYNGETYFAYWCYNTGAGKPRHPYKILFAKARSMEGPWSEPRELTWPDGTSISTTDPGVLWDHDTRKAWIGFANGAIDSGRVKIFALSWDGERMLQGEREGIVVSEEFEGEAVKLYKFDGRFYAMNAHWRVHEGVRQRMAAFFRAPNITGPWEGRLVMENGNGTTRCPSQGTLLKLDDGSWWFIHQLARGEPEERYNGRPQCLEPVTWKDGWPLIGVDTDGDGIGEVVWEAKKPIQGFPVTAPASDDDFSRGDLGLQWSWRFNPRMDRWSLTERPGFLRLKACRLVTPDPKGGTGSLPNLLAQRLLGRRSNVMTAKVDLAGMAAGQEAGLHLSAAELHAVAVRRNDSGEARLYFRSETKAGVQLQEGPALRQTELWLQARVEDGLATFFHSTDGTDFRPIGGPVRLFFAGFTPTMVGFYSMHPAERGHLDVDWFTYDYDGPKSPRGGGGAMNDSQPGRTAAEPTPPSDAPAPRAPRPPAAPVLPSAPASTSSTSRSDEITELSPFVVSENTDIGCRT